jgi:uncharacterized protein (DUF2249 family)
MIAGCPHFGVDSYCGRLNRSCQPTAKGCVLYGKVRLLELKGRGARMSPKMETLDVRPIRPFERFEKIFKIWNNLKPGEMLKIINDHDPKPLHHYFTKNHESEFQWEYEQEGPVDWIVKIKRI